jgi:hypothetical protein
MHTPVLVALNDVTQITAEEVMHALMHALKPWVPAEDDQLGIGYWDWWMVGGRWRGMFAAVAEPSERPLQGSPGLPEKIDLEQSGAEPPFLGWDVIRKRDIDWASTEEKRRREVERWWDAAQANRSRAEAEYVQPGEAKSDYVGRKAPLWVGGLLLDDGSLMRFTGPGRHESSARSGGAWERAWRAAVGGLTDDTVLVLLDCHG